MATVTLTELEKLLRFIKTERLYRLFLSCEYSGHASFAEQSYVGLNVGLITENDCNVHYGENIIPQKQIPYLPCVLITYCLSKFHIKF